MGGKAAVNTAVELLLGAIAGALAQLFTIPVSVIATRQQIGNTGGSSAKQVTGAQPGSLSEKVKQEKTASGKAKAVASQVLDDEESFIAVAKDIYKQDGIPGFWRGLRPSLVLTVNPAITYGVFERESFLRPELSAAIRFLTSSIHRRQDDHPDSLGRQQDDAVQVLHGRRTVKDASHRRHLPLHSRQGPTASQEHAVCRRDRCA